MRVGVLVSKVCGFRCVVLLVSFLLMISVFDVSVQAAKPARFFSMNLHCQFEDWRWRVSQIGKFLAATQPEAVFFQEVCDGDGQAMTKEIPSLLAASGYTGMSSNVLFAHDAWDGKYKEHLMVLTRARSSDSSFHWVSGALPGSGMRRVYLGFQFEGVTYVSVHLSADKDPKDRIAQIQFLASLASRRKAGALMIIGDFNSSPSDAEQKPLSDARFWPFFPGATEPLPGPKWSIDGAWLSPGLISMLQSTGMVRVLDRPVEGRWLSDHAAVMLSLH